MRNRGIATSMVVGLGLFANAAPAVAAPGGASAEPASPGGVPAGKASENLSPRAKVRYIKRHEADNTDFKASTLDAPDENAVIEVTVDGEPEGSGLSADKPGVETALIVDPVAILSANGLRIISYAGRRGESSLLTIPASSAAVTEWIGHVASPVDDPESLLASHTLHNTPGFGTGAVGFTAENGEGYGMMP